ncbi:hypothetical protein A3B63_03020 [Candidatus Saccharibacteria bacterium RIFCSPLOWO2_01_FULL_49_22]|nr:MAG: hypothetical protein A3B63_03020 [Candidatus Saccharibacteria bacterium RIFCSPLOWO2_01_FULL_49_22]
MAIKEGAIGRESRWRVLGGSFFTAGALAIAGCGGDNKSEGPTVTFDYLGGGDKTIRVYPGPEDTQADRLFNGFYEDGDEVLADCKALGREVESHPEVGEEWSKSKYWIRLDVPNVTQYATAVYIEKPGELLAQLEDC